MWKRRMLNKLPVYIIYINYIIHVNYIIYIIYIKLHHLYRYHEIQGPFWLTVLLFIPAVSPGGRVNGPWNHRGIWLARP